MKWVPNHYGYELWIGREVVGFVVQTSSPGLPVNYGWALMEPAQQTGAEGDLEAAKRQVEEAVRRNRA